MEGVHAGADEKIQAGNSIIRNPILTSFASKGLIPYRGLGTGVRRVMHEWPDTRFIDDREACTFAAVLALKDERDEPIKPQNEPIKDQKGLDEPRNETIDKRLTPLIALLRTDPEMTIGEMSEAIGKDPSTIKRWLKTLKDGGYIDRAGSRKSGRWEVSKDI